MFANDYTGVDLDHCVQADCSLDPWAQAYVDQLASYAEYSPGNGVHCFVRGALPTGGMRRKIAGAHPEAALEMYSSGRYFTITGRQVPGTSSTIEVLRTPLLKQDKACFTVLE